MHLYATRKRTKTTALSLPPLPLITTVTDNLTDKVGMYKFASQGESVVIKMSTSGLHEAYFKPISSNI